MAGNGDTPADRHRHRRPAALTGRRRAFLIVCAALVACAVVAVLVLILEGRSRPRAAATPVTHPATSSAGRSTTPPASVGTATATEAVPPAFAEAMRQIGIPLDAHTGWVIAQGICVRLSQPQYDQSRLAEGVERLFPSVPDEQAHAFVAMAATSVCHR